MCIFVLIWRVRPGLMAAVFGYNLHSDLGMKISYLVNELSDLMLKIGQRKLFHNCSRFLHYASKLPECILHSSGGCCSLLLYVTQSNPTMHFCIWCSCLCMLRVDSIYIQSVCTTIYIHCGFYI